MLDRGRSSRALAEQVRFIINLKPGEALGHAVPFTLLARTDEAIDAVFRHKADNPDQVRKDAAELVALAPDVVMVTSSLPTVALQRATRTVPIVFVLVADPVGSGIADSMARPGLCAAPRDVS